MIQEERAVFWEVAATAIVRKKVHMNIGCLTLNGYLSKLFESPELNPLDFCFGDWKKSKVYKRKVETRDELLARILDAAICIKKRVDQLR
jgi:hypothetical protein